MLNGPALLRVFLVVVAAAVLTGVVQHYWIFDTAPPEPPKTVARPVPQSTPVPVRRPEPSPTGRSAPAAPPAQAATPSPPATPPRQTSMFEPTPSADPAPPAAPEARAQGAATPFAPVTSEPSPAPPLPGQRRALPRQPEPTAQASAQPEAGQADASETEVSEPRAVDLVDLNTATLAALNALKGGGAIGRAIIQHRPYDSTDQLLSKRVLSRTTYQRIKDQVTVR